MTVHESSNPPSLVVTVITAVPGATAVTTPVLETVATLELLDDHKTLLSVAFSGKTDATSVSVDYAALEVVSLFKETPVTSIGPS